jgi:hypothetical protein
MLYLLFIDTKQLFIILWYVVIWLIQLSPLLNIVCTTSIGTISLWFMFVYNHVMLFRHVMLHPKCCCFDHALEVVDAISTKHNGNCDGLLIVPQTVFIWHRMLLFWVLFGTLTLTWLPWHDGWHGYLDMMVDMVTLTWWLTWLPWHDGWHGYLDMMADMVTLTWWLTWLPWHDGWHGYLDMMADMVTLTWSFGSLFGPLRLVYRPLRTLWRMFLTMFSVSNFTVVQNMLRRTFLCRRKPTIWPF